MQRTDDNLFVEFYMGAMPSEIKSKEQGYPVHIEVPFVRINIPGDINNQIDTRAEDHHKQRFAVQWGRFEAGLSQGIQGWRLEDWPAVSTAQVRNLKHLGVHTVEQMSNLTDTQCQKVGMGAMELRLKAKGALEKAKGDVDENAELKAQLAQMQAQLAELAAASAEPEKRGPGRPKKEAAEA